MTVGEKGVRGGREEKGTMSSSLASSIRSRSVLSITKITPRERELRNDKGQKH